MKVWTPGLHAFRAKHLHESLSKIPAHIPLFAQSALGRGLINEQLNLANRLAVLGRSVSTFSYALPQLCWNETDRILYLEPEPMGPFLELSRALKEILEVEADFRETNRMRLELAIGSQLSEYELFEQFEIMNPELLPLKCRATEIEVYRKKNDDWLLCESIPLIESEEN